MGVLDIPTSILNEDEFESQRVWKRTYAFSKHFQTAMARAGELMGIKKSSPKVHVKRYVVKGDGYSPFPYGDRPSKKTRCKRKTKSRIKVKKTFGKNKKKR